MSADPHPHLGHLIESLWRIVPPGGSRPWFFCVSRIEGDYAIGPWRRESDDHWLPPTEISLSTLEEVGVRLPDGDDPPSFGESVPVCQTLRVLKHEDERSVLVRGYRRHGTGGEEPAAQMILEGTAGAAMSALLGAAGAKADEDASLLLSDPGRVIEKIAELKKEVEHLSLPPNPANRAWGALWDAEVWLREALRQSGATD